MSLIILLVVLALLAGAGWLARARRLRRARLDRVHEVLLQVNLTEEKFALASLDPLPTPAQAYLRHALRSGAALARTVDLRMRGELRVAGEDWVPFEARQRVCAERGFIWDARIAAMRGLWLRGADWMLGEQAGLEHALADWWPVLDRRTPGVARSAAGRLMLELLWLPAALTPQRGARWSRGDSDRAVVTPAGSVTPMNVVVGQDGRLREASIVRHHVSANGESSMLAYGVTVEAEAHFGELCVPTKLVAAWGIGTDDRCDFMRLSVEDIRWF
jgi:hypothetical protein